MSSFIASPPLHAATPHLTRALAPWSAFTNVAGSRESKEPGIHDWVMQVLGDALF
jgi:hypothetical protein